MEEEKSVIDLITKSSGLSEVAKLSAYSGYLDDVGEVEVTVRDRGVGERSRFSVSARTLDFPVERTAAGNSEAELDTAIVVVHWDDLKKPGWQER
ncbi:hypothetical protein [Arthrobacter sp. H14-L1]|uniref:hypothetical protein n=1 Tax=Arthrobacter sp. H14-L1 TaxID=2996697 RepID=UPI00226ECA0A|nr:hypothetical protein [Arthrobacter sp. H14-L1]MCY0906423.1 hypothetical protein [Arthrobacter sp. H14-L1]